MSDLESYVSRCYDMLLQREAGEADREAMCECVRLVNYDNQTQPLKTK